MTSSVKKLSSVQAEVSVEIPKQQVNEAFNQTYAKLGRTTQIRGFRRGKVPRAVLRRMFGKTLGQEILKDLIPSHLQAAIEEHELDVIGQPEIDAQDVAENQDYSFVAKLELRPALEKIEYGGIELKRYKIPVQPEDVDRELARIRSSMAQVIDLEEPRPVQNGDLVRLKMKRWKDGEWLELPGDARPVVVGESLFGKLFDEGLIGMTVDEEKVVDLGSSQEMEKDRVRYLVTVTSVQGRELPELDDEFAKDLGDFETLEDLRASIDEGLTQGIACSEERRLMAELFDALREKNPMELPPGLVERQTFAIQMNMESLRAQAGKGQLDMEERKKMIERASEQARQMVHQHLLVREVARLENLEVTDEEVDEEIGKIADERGIPLPMLRAEYFKDENIEHLRVELLERKLFDFAKSKVKITETDVSEELTEEKQD